MPTMSRFWKPSPAAGLPRGSRSSMRASSWAWPRGNASRSLPSRCSVTPPRSGGYAGGTSSAAWISSSGTGTARDARSGFPPLQRAQIVQLACLEPVAQGLHLTHWSSEDLARQAVADGIIEVISPRTVRQILHDVDLQPHRTRYWKTSRLDATFKDRAEKILWCYGNAGRLAACGLWVVCVDEIPNFQLLQRHPLRRAVPGSIEQQEFEYTRHGTVNILVFLVVHTGKMEALCLGKKDAPHYTQALE